jgi:hypothetical protein
VRGRGLRPKVENGAARVRFLLTNSGGCGICAGGTCLGWNNSNSRGRETQVEQRARGRRLGVKNPKLNVSRLVLAVPHPTAKEGDRERWWGAMDKVVVVVVRVPG